MSRSVGALSYSNGFRTELGGRIRLARIMLGMNQAQLAVELGISRQTLVGYEKGHSEPACGLLAQLCSELAIDADWLLTGRGTLTPIPAVPSISALRAEEL